MIKKSISILLCIAVIFAFASISFAANGVTQARHISFGSDSKLRIMHITDLHLHEEDDAVQMSSLIFIERMIKTQKPDLIVITGDIATNKTLERTVANVDTLMSLLDSLNVPVAVNFGNHDTEKDFISREALMAEYMKHECCIAVDDGDLLPGCGTYNIPVMSSDGERIAFNIWMIESGDTDEGPCYAPTDKKIVDWYVERSNELKARNGGKPVNSLMFQHIIVPEIYQAFKETSALNPFAISRNLDKKRYFILDKSNTSSGQLVEAAGAPRNNSGQFAAAVKQGDVLAMFFGHDHSNTFNVSYSGIDLVATPKAQFGLTSSDKSDFTDSAKGARMIIVDENDTSKYQTYLVTFGELYTRDEVKNLESEFERDAAKKAITYNSINTVITALRNFFLKIFSL